MPSLGPMEILVILVVALLVLGPTKLPEAGRQLGRALVELRRWSSGFQRELQDALEPEPQPPPPTPPTWDGLDEVPTPTDLDPPVPPAGRPGQEDDKADEPRPTGDR